MKKSRLSTILLVLAVVFLMCGCETKTSTNDPIKAVSIKNLSEFADEFANKSYDYFYQFEADYQNYEVRKIELNYYKDGKMQDNLFCFMRDEDDIDVPNIQYVYLAYNFNESVERDIDAYLYLYDPTQPNKYTEKYSGWMHPETRTVEFDRLERIYPFEKIDNQDSKFYINPIVLDAPVNSEMPKDMTTSELIQDGYELMVLEVELS